METDETKQTTQQTTHFLLTLPSGLLDFYRDKAEKDGRFIYYYMVRALVAYQERLKETEK